MLETSTQNSAEKHILGKQDWIWQHRIFVIVVEHVGKVLVEQNLEQSSILRLTIRIVSNAPNVEVHWVEISIQHWKVLLVNNVTNVFQRVVNAVAIKSKPAYDINYTKVKNIIRNVSVVGHVILRSMKANNFSNYVVTLNGKMTWPCWSREISFVFSSPKCHDEGKQEFADYHPVKLHQCVKCNKPIEKTQSFSYYEDNTYHNDCFTCNRCGLSLVDKPCTRLGSAIVCPHCN